MPRWAPNKEARLRNKRWTIVPTEGPLPHPCLFNRQPEVSACKLLLFLLWNFSKWIHLAQIRVVCFIWFTIFFNRWLLWMAPSSLKAKAWHSTKPEMWWKKNHQEADNPIYSLFIPFDQIMFFPSSPSFFYSFLSRFVFALVQSSPIANDDLCWRFCCCHTKLVHSERLRNFRYYFFLYFEILKQVLLSKNERK